VTGEAEGSGLRVAFDGRLKIEFQGATVTLDALYGDGPSWSKMRHSRHSGAIVPTDDAATRPWNDARGGAEEAWDRMLPPQGRAARHHPRRVLASCRSSVSCPSVNQPYTRASRA
jgi:hypothetical protein